MQGRREITKQALLLLAVLVIPLGIVFALSHDDSSATRSTAFWRTAETSPDEDPDPDASAPENKNLPVDTEEDDGENGSPDRGPCAERGHVDNAATLKNAKLFYRNYQGEEPEPSTKVNRATGCLLETGRKTDLEFNNTIEGQSFGKSMGAGDYVAFVMVTWEAADESDDGFAVWNLRTGKPVFDQPACEKNYGQYDCYVSDIALSASGSAAFSACSDDTCDINLIPAGSTKASRVGQVGTGGKQPPDLFVRDGRLFYGKNQSVSFH